MTRCFSAAQTSLNTVCARNCTLMKWMCALADLRRRAAVPGNLMNSRVQLRTVWSNSSVWFVVGFATQTGSEGSVWQYAGSARFVRSSNRFKQNRVVKSRFEPRYHKISVLHPDIDIKTLAFLPENFHSINFQIFEQGLWT